VHYRTDSIEALAISFRPCLAAPLLWTRSVISPRSTRALLDSLEKLQKNGVQFICRNPAIDTTTAAGQFFVKALAIIVKFEHTVIRERNLEGQNRARAAGRRIGRPPIVLNIEAVRRLREGGLSLRKIAAQLGCSMGVIQRALANFSPQPESAGHPRPAADASQTALA
jgi:DNA invertase Pin-like site-specific DNA recombinase